MESRDQQTLQSNHLKHPHRRLTISGEQLTRIEGTVIENFGVENPVLEGRLFEGFSV